MKNDLAIKNYLFEEKEDLTMSVDKFKNLFLLRFKLLLKDFYLGTGSIIAIIFSILLQFTLSNASFNGQKGQFILSMTVFFNSIMSAIMMISIPIAQEKEKNQLKISIEYLFTPLIPAFLIIMGINIILPLLSGVQMTPYFYIIYMFITMILTIISLIIGLLIGVSSKKISNTSYLITYTILFLTLIPQIGTSNGAFEKISDFIYTGVLLKMLMNVSTNQPIEINKFYLFIILIEFISLIILFLLLIRKKRAKINQ